jgi:hypothetical protein
MKGSYRSERSIFLKIEVTLQFALVEYVAIVAPLRETSVSRCESPGVASPRWRDFFRLGDFDLGLDWLSAL